MCATPSSNEREPATAAEATPRVSILIVTWNRRDDLMKSIRSALAQTQDDCEVVVVDNASTDGTAEAVAREFPGVRLIRYYKNLGCPSGRNVGFANCYGEYVYLLDDDGWLEPDAVSRAVARADADPSIAVVTSRIREIEGERVVRDRPPEWTAPAVVHSFVGCCSLLRLKALDEAGAFPDDFFRQAEEDDLALRLLDAGWRCFFEPSSIMYHRPSPVGRSRAAFLYYGLRNTMKTGLRMWPFPVCLGRVAVNFGHAFKAAFTRGWLHLPVMLAGALAKELWGLRRRRRPVRRETFATFRRLKRQPEEAPPLS